MQTIEASYHGMRIGQHVIIIVLHYGLEVFELIMSDSLQHIEAIGCVVKQGPRLACRYLTFQAVEFTHIKGTKQGLRSDTLQVITRVDTVELSDQIEHPWREVIELILFQVPYFLILHRKLMTQFTFEFSVC